MGLDVPDLDDREYAALLDDAKKRIPVHAEEWTDHNVHDPGITILELLAWVAESDVYQLNRVGNRHVRKYLKLMGVRPRPPQPATARLQIDPQPALEGVTIPAGERLTVDDGSPDTKAFETTSALTVTNATLTSVVTEHQGGQVDNTNANQTRGMYFYPFGERARLGSSVYLGFDADPFSSVNQLAIAVDFHEANLPSPASHGDEESLLDPSVEVVWEYCVDYDRWRRGDPSTGGAGAWEEVTELTDGTEMFYRGGRIVLEKPAGWADEAATILDQDRELYWLRCTVNEMDDVGYEVPPQVNSIALNVVEAKHRASVDGPVELVRSDGGTKTSARPGQTFVFEHAPIRDADIRVGDTTWDPVPDFDASGPDETHYVLDRERGAIRFGDNVRGTVPEAGQVVQADSYTYGGGTAGNVPESAKWEFERDDVGDLDVTPLARITGGADAETVDAAMTRLKRDRKTPYRAVSPSDYRYLATHTPGLRFGRASTVVERKHLGADCAPTSTVRVVVVPFSTLDRPEPSQGFLDAVECHLQHHRLVTDRIEVESPTYVGVSVVTEVGIREGFSESGRETAVEHALDEFLHPLRGFDGDGWPFGRPVYRSEVYEAIERVDGVECVHTLSIGARGASRIDEDGNVVIADGSEGSRVGLVYPEAHDVAATPDRTDCGGP